MEKANQYNVSKKKLEKKVSDKMLMANLALQKVTRLQMGFANAKGENEHLAMTIEEFLSKTAETKGPAWKTSDELAESFDLEHIGVVIDFERKVPDWAAIEGWELEVGCELAQREWRAKEKEAVDCYAASTIKRGLVPHPPGLLVESGGHHQPSFRIMYEAVWLFLPRR